MRGAVCIQCDRNLSDTKLKQLIGWIITYTVSLNNGHIDPVLPFISHTGVKLPESALFTLIHSVSSVTGALIIYIRNR